MSYSNYIIINGNSDQLGTGGGSPGPSAPITPADLPSNIPVAKVETGLVDANEFNALNGVTGNIQQQINDVNTTIAGLPAGITLPILQSDVTGLGAALSSKAPLVHTHPIADVTGLQAQLDSLASSGGSVAIVADIAALIAYSGSKTSVIVKDDLRGDLFNYVATGLTVDNGLVFDATGKGSGYWQREYDASDYISVAWFGAVGDWNGSTGTDDRTAINACIASVNAIRTNIGYASIIFPKTSAGSAYRVTGTLTPIKDNVNVIMDYGVVADISVQNPGNIMEIGTTTSMTTFKNYKLNVSRKTASDWSSLSNVGVKMYNVSNSTIELNLVQGFSIGAEMCAYNGLSEVNEVIVDKVLENKYGIKLTATGSGQNRKNIFESGFFSCSTGLNATLDRAGIYLTHEDGISGTYYPTANVFNNPSFDYSASTGEGLPVWVEYGSYNDFNGIYSINTDQYLARLNNVGATGFAVNNTFSAKFINHNGTTLATRSYIDNQGVYMAASLKVNSQEMTYRNLTTNVFASARMQDLLVAYSATLYHVKGYHWLSSSFSRDNTTDMTSVSIDSTLGHLTIPSTRAIVRWVDTTDCKRFVFTHSAVSGFRGRLLVKCYDSTNTVITTGLKSVGGLIAYGTSFGGAFRSTSDLTSGSTTFEVPSNCVKMEVGVAGGSQVLKLFHMRLATLEDYGAVSSWCDAITEENLANVVPTAITGVTYTRGRIVYNDSATLNTGAPSGWIYTGATNGWKPLANIA